MAPKTTFGGENSKAQAPFGGRCHKCSEYGHRATECRKSDRQGKNLLVEEEYFDHAQEAIYDNYEDEFPEEILHGDKGESLIIKRACYAPLIEDNDLWLHNNIFHSTCTIGGKVCRLIIDSGSCENIVAEEVVEKLKLDTKQHPNPYQLSWLKSGGEIKVSKKCLIHFSIANKFNEKVWCDVISMDACHLLLGRPWQYDRNTFHDGRKNTYSFSWDNKRIVLSPSKEFVPKPHIGKGSNLLGYHKFADEVEESNLV